MASVPRAKCINQSNAQTTHTHTDTHANKADKVRLFLVFAVFWLVERKARKTPKNHVQYHKSAFFSCALFFSHLVFAVAAIVAVVMTAFSLCKCARVFVFVYYIYILAAVRYPI